MEETVKYVGIDVHSKASVWCALDESGRQLATGKSETTFPALQRLAERLRRDDEVIVGQEVGTQVYLVALLDSLWAREIGDRGAATV